MHGKYAGGVSKYMEIPTLAEQAKLKGLNAVVTADMTHKTWLEHVKENLVEEEGVYWDKNKQTSFIIGTEVESKERAHHLIYFESVEDAEKFREKVKEFGSLDCIMCGRPKLRLTPEQVAEKAEECNAIYGPAHSFTPYTGIYAYYDSVKKAYGEFGEKIKFIELGLSADTFFADLMKENHSYAFLSSSDAHSPWPNRLGREFNKIKMKKPCFKELKKALEEREEKLVTLNAGLDPREGKYHKTACNQCYAKYELEEAQNLSFKCRYCKGIIKKGVKDRILELAEFKEEKHPKFRPPYLHMLPLSEIIQLSLEVESSQSKRVQSLWNEFVAVFGNEINVLIEAKKAEMEEVDKRVAEFVESFRKGFVVYESGGGGNYGKPFICLNEKELEEKTKELEEKETAMKKQKSLKEF